MSVQNPVVLEEMSQPQHDLCLLDSAVVRSGRHPRPEDIFLVIEVADSTLRYDREDKRPAYAKAKVREYWLLNLADNALEAYHEPRGDLFRQARVMNAESMIAPQAFPDLVLRVGDFLP